MKHKPSINAPKLALASLLRAGGVLPTIFLVGCSSISAVNTRPPTDKHPAGGDLFTTLQALETGQYEKYLQSQRSELRYWQQEQTKQKTALTQLQAQQARLRQEARSLTQASIADTQRKQDSQHKIQTLSQQRQALSTETQNLQAATRQLEQAKQQQTEQASEQQQRIKALLAERERLRKALKLMINSDSL